MGRLIHLADTPTLQVAQAHWQALNEPLGITNFGVSSVLMEPGADVDIEHDEADCGHQEVYVVVAGRAWFAWGDERVEAGVGDVVSVPDPAQVRDYGALEPGTRVLCFGAGPGAEFPYGSWIARAAAER